MMALTLTWKWRLLARVVVALTGLLRWQVDVEGLDHVPRRGGAVLAFNHHSYVDFLFVAWPPVRLLQRPVRFLAKREIFDSRWVGWVARWGDAVPVERSSSAGRRDALAAAVSALRAGDLVAVAPEQTISPSFELLPLRAGAVRMAQQAGVPVVPVAGWGSHRAVTKGHPKRLRFGLPITVRFGTPVIVPADEDPVAGTARLEIELAGLVREVQRTYEDGAPAGASWVPARLGGGAPPHDQVLRAHEARVRGWDAPPSNKDTT